MPVLVALLLLSIPSLVQAAPGEIAQAPVSQSTGVKPNIMLILDDSGSMTFEDTLNNGVEDEFNLTPSDSVRGYSRIYEEASQCTRWEQRWSWWQGWYDVCVSWETSYEVDSDLYAVLGTCRGFNVMAYDPQNTYEPWPGFDDASLSNMQSLYYLRWDDDDGDGEYDFGECGYTKNGSEYQQIDNHRVNFSDPGMSSAERQNYANWFQYYRSRMMASQAALLGLVGTVDGRIGFNTIHDREDVDVDDLTSSQRASLSSAILDSEGSGGTPLRSALDRTGKLFTDPDDTPILPEASGGMCQQNYAVLMSDGYYDLENGLPNYGNVDGGNDPLIRSSDKDDVSYTLADFAMKYYLEDLSDLDDLVPTVPGVDENPAQHLVTYTVGFGVSGSLDSNPSNPDAPFDDWPEGPTSNIAQSPYAVDDMRHAAWNSRGKFLSAANPVELLAAFDDIAGDISARSVSTGSLAISRFETGDENVMLQTQYDPATWGGDVLAREFNADGSLKAPSWSFSTVLEGADYAARKVYTYNPDGSEGSRAFEFVRSNWHGNDDPDNRFSQTQKRDLLKGFRQDGSPRYPDVSGADYINYFRGDSQHEGTLRARENSFLGDIINSSPVIVGAPSDSYPDTMENDSYSEYRQSERDRDPVAYMGSNDGMLHAIDMADGSELFTFIPHGVFSTEPGKGLRLLAEKDYVHRYYVDGTPVARDAYIDLGSGSAWRTLLLGGLGGGGQSVYMLDITDPNDFGAASNVVKWEFSHLNLGYTFSDIEVAKLNNGKWYAIFGNGYNAEGHGQASLFLVNLEDVTDFIEVPTGVGTNSGGCTFGGSDCNGLSSPEIADLDGDGIYDWVYAGDLHGNIWAFDLTEFDGGAASVSTLRLFESCAEPSSNAAYSACPVGKRQPVSTRVAVERNPHFSSSRQTPYLNVYWGTGQMLAANDASDKSAQTFYSVLHAGTESPEGSEPAYFHDDLQAQSFVQATDASGDIINARYADGSTVGYISTGSDKRYGWYIDLPDSGERLVKRPVIAGDLVAFNTTVPGVGGVCEAASRGWLNALSLANGLPPRRNNGAYDATSGENQIFDYNSDGEFTAEDLVQKQLNGDDIEGGEVVVSVQMEGEPTAPEFIGDNQYVGVTNGDGQGDGILVQKTQVSASANSGRTGWYQLR